MRVLTCGGTYAFRRFLDLLCREGDVLERYEDPQSMPLCAGAGCLYVVLPDYEGGQEDVPPQTFEWVEGMRRLVSSGTRLYLENYRAQDYIRAALSGLQTMGRPRHLHQEYIQWHETLLQARDAYYLPAVSRESGVLCATVSNCLGTHRVFRPGTSTYPVLKLNPQGNVLTAQLDFSAYDSRYRRPYRTWQAFWVETMATLTGWQRERIAEAFRQAFPEAIGLARQTDPEVAVRQALAWHEHSGVLRQSDGSRGMFEMIRSDDLGIRGNLRTDAELLTAALFTSAGKKYEDERLTGLGCNLADFLLERGIQRPDGLIKWFDHTSTVWSSDCSRDGLALWQLYKTTGQERYAQAAYRLGDAFLRWLEPDGLCGGFVYEGREEQDRKRPSNNNPVYYGEMVAFLFQLEGEAYHQAAVRIIRRIGETFPRVEPFGFSENFTYSRWLLMLASAQYHGTDDYSRQIMEALEFFRGLQHPGTGAILEAPIRLTLHTEAGVAVGDGSDAIADMLYCDNFVLNALSILVRLPADRQGTLPMADIRRLYDALKTFWMKVQIKSPEPRLNGGWMRAFDVDLDEYFGLNKDMDWGAYCIMGGWVMGFVPLVLLYDGEPESMFVAARRG